MSLHRLLLILHRWVALVASLFILSVAVSGSAMVFEGAIDRAMNARLWYVEPANTLASLDSVAAHAAAMANGADVTGITLARTGKVAHVVQAGPLQIFVNPYTGDVIGTRTVAEFNKGFARRLHVFHVSLLSGKIGGEVVAIVTGVALLLVLTGIVLWWQDREWRINWSASWKRIVFDLHHALGIGAAVLLLIISGSGMIIHYDALGKAILALNESPLPPPPHQPVALPGARRVSLDSAAHAALAAIPGATLTFMSLPKAGDAPLVVAMRFPDDRTPGGRSRVFVDRYRGTALQVVSTRTAQTGSRISNVMRSVHTGDVFGKPTEFLWLLAALVLANQAVSGILMWWNGRGARKALARKVQRV